MTVSTTENDRLDFCPDSMLGSVNLHAAPILIERAIIEGSGGPDNVAITKAGLRFIRYLLSVLAIDRYSHLPNFKSLEAINLLAKLFICRCGSEAQALQSMQAIMHSTGAY